MWFFDIKIILITILAVVIYFIYKQLNKINFRVNTLFDMYKKINNNQQKLLQSNIDQFNFDEVEPKSINENNDSGNIFNNMFNMGEQNQLFNIIEKSNNLFNMDNNIQNNQNLMNIVETLTSGFPDNIISGCIIKTINIPLDNSIDKPSNIINMSSENIKVQTTEETEESYPSGSDHSNIQNMVGSTEQREVDIPDLQNVNEDRSNEDRSNENESETLDVVDIPDESETLDVVDISLEASQNEDQNILDDKKHIEIYSNENTPIETNTTIEINKINKSSDDIIKNINKFKLPELQDLAIEYNISMHNNNKKKSKNELIDDIKKYILNKNI